MKGSTAAQCGALPSSLSSALPRPTENPAELCYIPLQKGEEEGEEGLEIPSLSTEHDLLKRVCWKED